MINDFKMKAKFPLRKATLCFLVEGDKVLLAMKKRGFGKDLYNGVGGKQSNGENIKQTAIRETEEEIGVKITELKKLAVLDFYFPYIPLKENWNQQVVVYVATAWQGKPKESEEMKPKWFLKNRLPFSKMWVDDYIWLPHVLSGKTVRAEFAFGKNQEVEDYTLKVY
jgi:8-oxo-dGTP pyrophosphatase MutT (NUDIX family)